MTEPTNPFRVGIIGTGGTSRLHLRGYQRFPDTVRLTALFDIDRSAAEAFSYWREGGPEFANVNVMAVAHGMEKEQVLAHKAAIDAHLNEAGISVSYTNVFWGGRSEIKPSEISPLLYREWLVSRGIDPHSMCEPSGAPA